MTRAHRIETTQLTLDFRQRGGARKGAGRKPSGACAMAPHSARPALSRHHPVHVTTRLCAGLPRLRHPAELEVLRRAFAAGADRCGCRLVHFSVQNDHLHLLLEAASADALSRGVKGLLVRIARALNRTWRRKGRVFADRFHAHALRTPREVRNALVYVLNNSRKHIGRYAGIDPGSSGAYFDGWTMCADSARRIGPDGPPPVVEARTWLLRIGWRRHGRIDPSERPATPRATTLGARTAAHGEFYRARPAGRGVPHFAS